jgi:hypothetical protein
MNRRYGPSVLLASLLALFLLPNVCWSAPQVKADAAYAKKIQAMLPPQVECVASSQRVTSGQSVTLTAKVKGALAGLVYSFSSNSGKLFLNGSTARLDTTGVPAGKTISATCQVTNGFGQKASGTVAVRVVAMQSVEAPFNASIADKAEEAVKDLFGGGGGGGAPQGGAQHRVVHHVKAAAPQGAEDQAAQAQQGAPNEGAAGAAPAPAGVLGGLVGAAGGLAAPAPPPPTVGGVDPYAASEAHAQWMKALNNGKIEYNIPKLMKLHETSVVTVIVHGFADTSPNLLPGAQTGTLKVSPYMRMQLTADDPDEFEIDPKAGAVLPVPIDSSAKWTWNVKPNQPASNQKLTIEAFTVYTENGDNPQELLPSYVATVSVSVPGFWESVREEFWDNPSGAIKYVLPGGAGFTVLAGLIVWWWKRRHPEEDKPKKDE